MQIKTLNELKPGEGGRIIQIRGGRGMANRLAALDIRPGTKITKISAGFMQGPVTIEVDRVQVAVGFGMAAKILVDVEDRAQ